MSPAIITLLVLVVAIIIFVSDRLPMGLVAFMVPMALYFTGVIDAKDIFASIVNANVILIVAMCTRCGILKQVWHGNQVKFY